jgi:hypothetical protein
MGKDGMNGKPGKGTLSKRLEQLEQLIRVNKPRHIVLEVDGCNENQEADDAILQELGVVDADLVIMVKHYSHKEGDPALPRLISVAPL